MNAAFYHNVTPRGGLTTSIRAIQEQSRIQRASRAPGVLLTRGPRGTFVKVANQRSTTNDSGSFIPRWG